MCGIAGFVDLSGCLLLGETLERTLEAMRFRGPDGVGSHVGGKYAIGMRRLSIIDHLTGEQPQSNESGQVHVVQNGEIYNFRSLREQLMSKGHSFKSVSDTEVLIHGYEEWGIEGLLSRIDGMFAFAVVDENQGVLHLARDRFGEKPVYLHFGHKVFGFASNMKALMSSLHLSQEIDPFSLMRYLALHYVPGRRTIFREVERLLPGERMEFSLIDGTCKRFKYYQMLEPEEEISNAEELEYLLKEAVESRLVSDVPVGVFLSGGLDSSFVTALAAKSMPQIKTFSIGFDSVPHDESKHAKSLANACEVDHHLVQFGEKDFSRLLPKVASVLDEPLGDQATLPTYKLCKEASRYVKVVLSGEGADEFFAGYGYYDVFARRDSFFQRLLGRSSFPQVSSLIDESLAITPSGFPLVTSKEVRNLLGVQSFGKTDDQWERNLVSYLDTLKDPLRRACAADVLTWLPDNLLVKLDRMTMSMSLEGRCPFLEKNLAEYAFRLPFGKKLYGSESKVALRSLAKKSFPEIAWKRKKQGFVLPMALWLKNYLEANGGTESFVNDRNCDCLDRDAVVEIIDRWTNGTPGTERALYALVMFLEWNYYFCGK
ncbi:MAG: asparagine synthase (glutamine-hydrolyzing) [Opitutae bacterium]|jgi:asparagine synthase (glutamine-hydrolysing)|nr:asparagine synthase (glutamine-hydrolyzing) [Opitutae bacterium]